MNSPTTVRRAIPSVDRLLKLDAVGALVERYGRPLVVDTIRAVLAEQRVLLATPHSDALDTEALAALCAARLEHDLRPSLRPVFNLTGTVLHTNLGRALYSQSVATAVAEAMTQPVNLELDIDSGRRGERDVHVEGWLRRLTGAEAATVVNNNAAAVYLALNTLASRKEVIVSRGELIEIGGAFRIPDIMASAGCRLREVGTTNRTHPRDYEDAIGKRTAALMKVHTSNYAIQGFSASVPERKLADIAHAHYLPLLADLGSGTLVDLAQYGLPHEPTARETLAAGADIVTFSGDKLLGGPQCGLLVGRADLIARIRRNPMKRALRVDKVTLAALEATLRLYADPDRAAREVPTLRLLIRPRADIEAVAHRVAPAINAAVRDLASASVIACASQIGSGALPVDALPSAGIAIVPRFKRRGSAVERLAAAFRALPVPVIGRIQDGALLLDLRCLDDEAGFVAQLQALSVAS